MPSGIKPLLELMLTQIYVVNHDIRPQWIWCQNMCSSSDSSVERKRSTVVFLLDRFPREYWSTAPRSESMDKCAFSLRMTRIIKRLVLSESQSLLSIQPTSPIQQLRMNSNCIGQWNLPTIMDLEMTMGRKGVAFLVLPRYPPQANVGI